MRLTCAQRKGVNLRPLAEMLRRLHALDNRPVAASGLSLELLEEPTTGLFFADIQRLLEVLHRLTEAGNTVIVIEHNLDVIESAG